MSSTLVHEKKLLSDILKCMEYMKKACTDVERVFRKPGLQNNVLILQKYFESDKDVHIPDILLAHPEITAHDISHLFKGMLRSVKHKCGQPIVNFVCYNPLLGVCKENLSPKETANKMAAILRAMMIPAHTALLKRLSLYFYDFSAHAATTKMDIRSLATCVAPSIFMRPSNKHSDDVTPEQTKKDNLLAEMNDMKDICQTFGKMIAYSHQIFGQIKDERHSRKNLPHRTQRSATVDFTRVAYTPIKAQTNKLSKASATSAAAAPSPTSPPKASPSSSNRLVPKSRHKEEDAASAAATAPNGRMHRARRLTNAQAVRPVLQSPSLPTANLASGRLRAYTESEYSE